MAGFVTIQELAEMMADNGHGDNINALAKKAWRAYRAAMFGPDARKTGEGTATIIIPASVASQWVKNGCPTPTQLPDHLNAARIAVLKMRDRAEEIRAGIVDDGQNDGPDPWAD